jgi:MFS family permease
MLRRVNLRAWFDEALAAPREMLGNRDLRRLQLANLGSVLGNWAYVVGLAVYAYGEGGAGLVGLVTVIRMVPAALAGPFVSVLGDRFSRRGTMIGADVLRAVMLVVAGVAIAADGPVWAVLTLVTLTNVTAMAFRPAYQAILPGLSRTPEELTAANVATSTINSVGAVVGPAIGGLLLAVSGTAAVFALNGASFLWSAALVLAVHEPERTVPIRPVKNPVGADALAGMAALFGDRRRRLLTLLYVAQAIVAGTIQVFAVVTVLELVGADESVVGLITAASGVGGLIGGALVLALVVRYRLSTLFLLGLALYGAPLAVVGGFPELAVAFAVFPLAGLANTLVDVPATTLMQRLVPDEMLSRAFGALNSLLIGALAVGALLAPALVDAIGARWALVVFGLALPILALLGARRLRDIDSAADAPAATELFRQVPLFALLPETALERLAAGSEVVRVPAGEVVFREGDAGDRFYVIADGEVEIAGKAFGPGEAFGEIALLRDVPRTATVTARSDVVLRTVAREPFVEVVTGHEPVSAAAEEVISARLSG